MELGSGIVGKSISARYPGLDGHPVGFRGAFSAEVKPLIPQDLPAAEHLLRQHSIFGRVIEGKLVKKGETQTLVCEVMVAPGNIQTVVIRLVGEKKTNE